MNIVKVKDVATFVRGVSYKKEQATKEKKSGYLPLLRANNISAGSLIFDDLVYVPKNLVIESQYVKPGDIIVSMSSGSKAHVGKVALAKQSIDYTFGAFCGKVSPLRVFPPYLYYLLCNSSFRQHIETICKGTNINNLKQSYIMDYEIPVPSFSEQIKIVSRIEELFSELDAGVETLQKTKQQLSAYRQAVLRQEFGQIDNTVKVSSICSVVRGGSPRPAGDKRYYNGYIPFLKVADLTRCDGMYLREFTYTIKPAGLQKTRMVPKNTLLLSNSGATLGIPKICTFETTMNDGIAAFLGLDMTRHYLPYHYYFWLSKTSELRSINQGAAQPNLNTGIIGDFDFPNYGLDTQVQIAQKIESRLSVCDSIEKTVDEALRQSTAMRQSVLKQAFEGGL